MTCPLCWLNHHLVCWFQQVTNTHLITFDLLHKHSGYIIVILHAEYVNLHLDLIMQAGHNELLLIIHHEYWIDLTSQVNASFQLIKINTFDCYSLPHVLLRFRPVYRISFVLNPRLVTLITELFVRYHIFIKDQYLTVCIKLGVVNYFQNDGHNLK